METPRPLSQSASLAPCRAQSHSTTTRTTMPSRIVSLPICDHPPLCPLLCTSVSLRRCLCHRIYASVYLCVSASVSLPLHISVSLCVSAAVFLLLCLCLCLCTYVSPSVCVCVRGCLSVGPCRCHYNRIQNGQKKPRQRKKAKKDERRLI